MMLFSAARRGRRDDAEMGKGVWRRAHDRFRRGLDRYHQILEGVQDEGLHAAAVPVANELADLLPRVRAVCITAHTLAPSEGMDIPASKAGYLSEVHRALSRSGNALAATAEALAMAKLDAPQPPQGAQSRAETAAFASITRRAQAVFDAVTEAERLLAAGSASPKQPRSG